MPLIITTCLLFGISLVVVQLGVVPPFNEDTARAINVVDFGSLELSPVDRRTLTGFIHTQGLQWNLNPLVHLHNSLVNLLMMLKLPSQLLPQAPKSPASAMSSWAKTLYFPQPIEPGQQGLVSGDAGTSTFSYFASGLRLPFISKASEANNCAGSNSPTT
ncbi:hypothetical protein CQW23_14271 [Capsicum baccatum]|uniref:Uncharacterized protein n=1 Tax=Capsicum baccatum TaxID=33114 RepID=A0A2G2WIQ1_CAPBA|nr:hypothetical protein CQW23_14271 [Capsicum baccatum]